MSNFVEKNGFKYWWLINIISYFYYKKYGFNSFYGQTCGQS